MTIPEILQKLAHQDNKFPRAALEAAITQQEAITPHLLEILDHAATNPNDVLDRNDFSYLYALFLLAQFREPRAYPLVIKLASLDAKTADELLGDTITEGLAQILASVCGGDTTLIKELAENPNAEMFVRGAALQSLVILVVQDIIPREEVIAYFAELFDGKFVTDDGYLWATLACDAADLYPEELYDRIKRVYEADLVDETVAGLDWIEQHLEKGKEACLAETKVDPHHQLIESAIKEMEWWAWYNEPSKPLSQVLNAPHASALGKSGTYIAPPKVGRNDPCICGSGKKYKKCCGQ
ncbi:MAG TPA: DUF1186 domain-containing protein [Blastocatellia bacterium]|nr:DUF1186 domain-containing protein [Blastocatellia bacterium]